VLLEVHSLNKRSTSQGGYFIIQLNYLHTDFTNSSANSAEVHKCILIELTPSVVTCEIKLFQNYFILCRRPSEIILFQRLETWLKLLQNYFTGLLQLMNIFQQVHCRWNNFRTPNS